MSIEIKRAGVGGVEAQESELLTNRLEQLEERLDIVARQTEATRKKVYREEIKASAPDPPSLLEVDPGYRFQQPAIRTGDPG